MPDEKHLEAIRELQRQKVRLSKEEQENIKSDLLFFIHRVTHGEYSTLDELQILPHLLELLARFFG